MKYKLYEIDEFGSKDLRYEGSNIESVIDTAIGLERLHRASQDYIITTNNDNIAAVIYCVTAINAISVTTFECNNSSDDNRFVEVKTRSYTY